MSIKKGTTTIATSSSTEWGCIEGNYTAQADLKAALDGKASILSPQLTGIPTAPTAETGTKTQQIATTEFVDNSLYKNATNCITEIPQDVKYTFENGRLTIKAGSKIYIPNGFEQDGTTRKFTAATIPADIVRTSVNGGRYTRCTIVSSDGTTSQIDVHQFSGDTAPSDWGDVSCIWYDTANNLVKRTGDSGSTWTTGWSLPIGLTSYDGAITGFQVFNGFGYIGDTIFALPGIKYIIPNGRNDDGTFNNVNVVTRNVSIKQAGGDGLKTFTLNMAGVLHSCVSSDSMIYYEKENVIKNLDGVVLGLIYAGNAVLVSNEIKSLEPKNTFSMVDYNDFLNLQKTNISYRNITNCFTAIPQDVNLILIGHTLTLKAGSKIYYFGGVSNSKKVFTSEILDTSYTCTLSGVELVDGSYVVWLTSNHSLVIDADALIFSGSSYPSSPIETQKFYKSNENKIYRYNGSAWNEFDISIPLGMVTVTNNEISSLDQVFNGIGYIGSAIFVLPGVKGLAPNGKNADGTFNNIEITVPYVDVTEFGNEFNNGYLLINSPLGGSLLTGGDKHFYYDKQRELLALQEATYISEENRIYRYGVAANAVYEPHGFLACTFSTDSNYKIINFSPKRVFSVLDINDKSSSYGLPDASGIITLGGEGTFTAPGNGWVSAISSYTYKVMVKNLTCKIYNGGTHNTPNEEAGSVPCNTGDSIEVSGNSNIETYFIPTRG